jgi:hypothetical protein
MNTCWNRGVESPAGFIMSYAPRKYNFIKTHIKNMTNFVNFAFNSLDNETMGGSLYGGWRECFRISHGFECRS